MYFEATGFDEIDDFDTEIIDEIDDWLKLIFPEIWKKFDSVSMNYYMFCMNIVEFKNEFNFYDMHTENIMKNKFGDFKLIDFQFYG